MKRKRPRLLRASRRERVEMAVIKRSADVVWEGTIARGAVQTSSS